MLYATSRFVPLVTSLAAVLALGSAACAASSSPAPARPGVTSPVEPTSARTDAPPPGTAPAPLPPLAPSSPAVAPTTRSAPETAAPLLSPVAPTALARERRAEAPASPAVSAVDADEKVTDLELTQRIRQRLAGDAGLSPGARNVKVVVQGGRAELSGNVVDDAEKRRVEAHAEGVVGASRLVTRLTRQR